jgi:predicted site-specific integrase-resolvase
VPGISKINKFQRAAVYARVSAVKQKDDLKRQIDFLAKCAREAGFTDIAIYKDVASGLNDKRPGLQRLIKDSFARKFTAVFITHKDRLARFGTRVLYQILELLHIEVKDWDSLSNAPKKDDSPTKELVNDVLAILTSYSGKLYRLRRGACA